MSSRYSEPMDVKSDRFAKMSQDWHDQAGDHVDNLYVKAYGISDLDTHFTTYAVPWVLKQIALHTAQMMYAEDNSRADDDEWDRRAKDQSRWVKKYDGAFTPRMLYLGNTDTETPDAHSGPSARMERV